MSIRDTTQTAVAFSAINSHGENTKLNERSGVRHFKNERTDTTIIPGISINNAHAGELVGATRKPRSTRGEFTYTSIRSILPPNQYYSN